MSWDAECFIEADGHEIPIGNTFNYTHNTNPMIRKAGFAGWNNETLSKGVSCRWFCDQLETVIAEMTSDIKTYRDMNPENGWGNADRLLTYLSEMLATFRPYPSATVRVEF